MDKKQRLHNYIVRRLEIEVKLEDQVLKYFQETLSDLPKLGDSLPPSEMFVSQISTDSAPRRWKVDKNDSIELPIGEPLPELDLKIDPKSDLRKIVGYYPHGRANFSIFSDPPRVRVLWWVGPLFGRGFNIPIIDDKLDVEKAIPFLYS